MRYENPTMEFRQVRVEERLVLDSSEIIPCVCYRVQQKWLVQDGERYEKEGLGSFGSEEAIVAFSRLEQVDSPPVPLRPLKSYGWYVRLKPEWRNLPEVSEEEAKAT